MADPEKNKNLEQYVGPAAKDFGHATGVLAILERARNLAPSEWRGKAVTQQDFIKAKEAEVRAKVQSGELTADALSAFGIYDEYGEEEPTDWRE